MASSTYFRSPGSARQLFLKYATSLLKVSRSFSPHHLSAARSTASFSARSSSIGVAPFRLALSNELIHSLLQSPRDVLAIALR